ncbi:MAG: glycosyltransferase family 4 protein [Acidobacteriota bacterium]
MKIVLYACPKVHGGLMRHVEMLGRALSEKHDVTIVLPEALQKGIEPSPLEKRDASDREVEEIISRKEKIEHCVVKGKFDWLQFVRLYRFLKRKGPDLFHVHLASPGESTLTFIAAFMAGVPATLETEHAPSYFPLERFYSRIVKRFLTKFMGRVIALSENGRRLLIQRYSIPSDKIAVIYNGIEIPEEVRHEGQRSIKTISGISELEGSGIDEDSTIVTTVSEITERKGIPILLQAAEELVREENKVHFLIIGEGVMRLDLWKRYKNLIDSRRVHFLGYKKDISTYLSISDIFVLPSFGEEFPLSVLEAMAHGVPVIATRVGGVPEMIQHLENGWLVKPGDAAELAAAIHALMKDGKLALTLSKNAYDAIRTRFSAAEMVRQTEAVYASLIAGKKR